MTVLTPTHRHNRFLSAVAPTAGAPLPAWPILVLLYGFPLVWAMGMMQFAPTLLAAAMIVLMVVIFGCFGSFCFVIVGFASSFTFVIVLSFSGSSGGFG